MVLGYFRIIMRKVILLSLSILLVSACPTAARQLVTTSQTIRPSQTTTLSLIRHPKHSTQNHVHIHYVDTQNIHDQLDKYQQLYFLGQVAHGVLFHAVYHK